MIKILKKHIKVRLIKGLSAKEFQCKCKYVSCTSVLASKQLIKAYGAFRLLVNRPLKINSGHRCPQHNYKIGGKPLSRHQSGEAIDISLSTIKHLTGAKIKKLAIDAGFTKIIFYKSFIHLDVR